MLEVIDLTKVFATKRRQDADVVAVDNVSFVAKEGVFLTLLGPSGCGKTTTLRSVAGLETPDSGAIRVAGRALFSSTDSVNVKANMRGLGMVFQSYAIWPHMNVYENVAFPLTVRRDGQRLSTAAIRDKVERVLDVVRLGDLDNRPATDLSGGQQQRLALARALVGEPPLLLLDEPLSNLDAKLREQLRFELKRLQRELGVTTLYVTHDQSEALSMSNELAVMDQGVIQQIGRPRDVYERPATAFVADFIGTSNFIKGKVARALGGDLFVVSTPVGELTASSSVSISEGGNVTVAIRPEHIQMGEGSAEQGIGRWPGRVKERAFLGESLDYLVEVGTEVVRVRCNATLQLPTGTEVTLTFTEDYCSLLPGD